MSAQLRRPANALNLIKHCCNSSDLRNWCLSD